MTFSEQQLRARPASLGRNGLINVLGQLTAAAVLVGAVPPLLHGLGRDRFGLLTLAWAAVGWFSVFDFGLGRATTHVVATGTGRQEQAQARSLASLTVAVLFALGCLAGGIAALTTPLLISDVLQVPKDLRAEAEAAFFILSASLPFVLASAGTRGVLEGVGWFGWINAVRVPSSVLLAAIPVLLLPITHDLRVIVATITVNRFFVFIAFGLLANRALGARTSVGRLPAEVVKRTLAYAGWTGATNALGAGIVFGYVDRYVVGAVVGLSSVPIYATPIEIVTKLLLYPMALMAVYFPAFSRSHKEQDSDSSRLEESAFRALVLPLVPLGAVGIAATNSLLTLYIGSGFAQQATRITQLLLLGALCICISQVPFTMLQAGGRSDLTAKRHAAQLIIYVPVVIGMTSWLGTTGTAITWFTWAISDTALLFYLARRYMRAQLTFHYWFAVSAIGVALITLAFMISTLLDGWSQIVAGVTLGAAGAGLLWLAVGRGGTEATPAPRQPVTRSFP